MNEFEKLLDFKRKTERIVEGLQGREVQYKGDYGTIIDVHLDGVATVYLEDAEGIGREEILSWGEIVKNMKF